MIIDFGLWPEGKSRVGIEQSAVQYVEQTGHNPPAGTNVCVANKVFTVIGNYREVLSKLQFDLGGIQSRRAG